MLGSVDLQQGSDTGYCSKFGVGDSPSTNEDVSLVAKPCVMKWSCNKWKGADLAVMVVKILWLGWI